MTSLKELSNHVGGLIKILDPIAGMRITHPASSQLYSHPTCQSGQIALLLKVLQGRHKYELYQAADIDMYANNRHTPDDPLEIVARLLINGEIYDVSIYPHRVELL